ncbi:MAG: epoxyqueuosine reductase QueH [Candidatus Pacebacteria bacterium]|nr:epoxyqueuosine reductase QueH [Candidatus Paceibacterota bacterium]
MLWWQYLTIFIAVFVLSVFLTEIVRKIALRFKIVDWPKPGRKIHLTKVPLMGGLAVFIAFFSFAFIFKEQLLSGNLNINHWLSVFIGAGFLIIGGILDDKYNLKPKYQIIFPILAVISVILGGVEISQISGPSGDSISLSSASILSFFSLSELFLFIWLLGMMYTTKLLDGLDGLVSGLTFIGSLIIFLFTITTKYYQPDIGLASLILAGAVLGFLLLNWHPAKIFLGEGGSLLLGYLLGVLAIISGGKIAITLLVMALPILDVAWTIIRRMLAGKNPFKVADKKHLHHRFLSLGWGQVKSVLVFYIFALVFGIAGLFLQSQGKFYLLVLLLVLMFLIVAFFTFWEKQQKQKKPKLLLHICCAGCGVYVASEILNQKYQVIFFYYNPNIYSFKEYRKRLKEVNKVGREFNLKVIASSYDHQSWLEKIKGYEREPEKGKRCHICYRDRLKETAREAKKRNIKYFTSTLTMSTHKDANLINKMGDEVAKDFGLEYKGDNFKKAHGCQRSASLSKKLNLYRQDFCGCEFSLPKK